MAGHHSRSFANSAVVAVLVVLVTIAAVILSWGVVSIVGAQEDGSQSSLTPATDSVTFDAAFQAEEKPVEVIGQYARTYVRGASGDEYELLSGYSGERQPRQTEEWTEIDDGKDHEAGTVNFGTACVYGGNDSTASCGEEGDAASASLADGYTDDMLHLAELLGLPLGILTPPNMKAGVTVPLGVQARCALDENGNPDLYGSRPTGTISAGTGVLLEIIENVDHYDLSTLTDDGGNLLQSGMTTTRSKFNFALLGPSYVDTEITLNWGIDELNLRAFSEVNVAYRGRVPQLSWTSPWDSHTIRSECGLKLSDGRGSTAPQGASSLPTRSRETLIMPPATSAPGSPQTFGFITEDTMSLSGMDYHLLATRELDALDRLEIEAVLAEIAASGDVEGPNWKLFDAQAAGELVPVVEIELFDGAIAQARPMIPGASLPVPDVVITTSLAPTPTPTTSVSAPPTTTPAPTTSATTTPEDDGDE